MRKNFLLVYNPTAGLSGRTLLSRVVASLEAAGARVTAFTSTRERAPDARAVVEGGYDAVIAAGGDGTVRAVGQALAGAGIPVGFVPMGTGNVLAHEIGLPSSPGELARVLMHGPVVRIEGARANNEPFYLMAGVGFDGAVIERLDHRLKRRIGKSAYVAPVLKALKEPLPDLEVVLDGVRHQASWVVVTKACRYGGRFVLAPDAGLRKATLMAVLVRANSKARLIRQLLALPLGRLVRQGGVETVACRRAEITATTPASVEIDGDAYGTTPLRIEAGGAALSLIVPETY